MLNLEFTPLRHPSPTPTPWHVFGPTRGTHPDVVLGEALPEAVVLRIYRHYHVVDALGDGVLALQVHPRGKVHDALRQLLYVKRMQRG